MQRYEPFHLENPLRVLRLWASCHVSVGSNQLNCVPSPFSTTLRRLETEPVLELTPLAETSLPVEQAAGGFKARPLRLRALLFGGVDSVPSSSTA